MRTGYLLIVFTLAAILLVFTMAFLLIGTNWQENAGAPNAIVAVEKAEEKAPEIKECDEGKRKGCKIGACAGEMVCIGGKWTKCLPVPKKCVPNYTIACAYDECRFGAAKCNECGSGYGKCELALCEENSGCSLQ